ncbi:MAG: TrbI/VirB10 family protein [Succinivibrio sp.]
MSLKKPVNGKVNPLPLIIAAVFIISTVMIVISVDNPVLRQKSSTKTEDSTKEPPSVQKSVTHATLIKKEILGESRAKEFVAVSNDTSFNLDATKSSQQQKSSKKNHVLSDEDFYKAYLSFKEKNDLIDQDRNTNGNYSDTESNDPDTLNKHSVKTDDNYLNEKRYKKYLEAKSSPIRVDITSHDSAMNSAPDVKDRTTDSTLVSDNLSPRANRLKTGNLSDYRSLENRDFILDEEVIAPKTPYALMQGSSIPAILITGINSELPGQVTAQVTRDIRDSISSKYLLIPHGTKIVGQYASNASFGANRVFLGFNRLIFPNGSSLYLGAMPGQSYDGYSGLDADVDNHYFKNLIGALLFSSIKASGSSRDDSSDYANTMRGDLSDTASTMAQNSINLSPILKVSPGFSFSIAVTKDIFFKSPYGADSLSFYIN